MTHEASTKHTHAPASEGVIDSVAGLVALIATGTALGLALWWLGGSPHMTTSVDWAETRRLLTGSRLPDADALAAAASIGWIALSYLAFSVGVRIALVAVAQRRGEHSWIHGALRVSDLITIPIVQRSVDRGVGGMLLLAAWLPTAPTARVANAVDPAIAAAVAPHPYRAAVTAVDGDQPPDAAQGVSGVGSFEYEVAPGDSLWDIARRFYGDGSRYVEIFHANAGRVMSDGTTFNDPQVIRPGWSLAIPLPVANLAADDGQMTYRVQQDDDLWRIAARFLGDGFRWTEIWELNRDREMEPGRRFADPNLICPGWHLELPIQISRPEAAQSPLSSPTTNPTSVAPSPTAIPDQPSQEPVGGSDYQSWPWPSVPREAVFSAAGFAILGGTVIFVRRAFRDRLHGNKGDDHHGTGDAGRVTVALRALRRALADFGFDDSRAIFVVEHTHALEVTIECPPGDVEALVRSRYDLGRRLACAVEGEVIGSTRAVLRLSSLNRLAALLAGSTTVDPVLPVPVGATDEGILYLDLAAVGSVVIAGSEGEQGRLIEGWLRTLAVTNIPTELAFHADRVAASSIGTAANLPHFAGTAGTYEGDGLATELDEVVVVRGTSGEAIPLIAFTGLTPTASECLQPVIRNGPAVNVFTVAMIPQSMPPSTAHGYGASLVFGGGETNQERATDAPGSPSIGGITLTIGRGETIALEPVRVRIDTSTRWTDEGEPAPLYEHEEITPDDDLVDNALPELDRADSFSQERDIAEDDTAFADTAGLSRSDMNEQASAASAEPIERGLESGSLPVRATFSQDSMAEPSPTQHAMGETGVAGQAGTNLAEPAPTSIPEGSSSKRAPVPGTAVAAWQEPLMFDDEARASNEIPPAGRLFAVRCFDRFSVVVDEREISAWPLQKSRELLAYLVARGEAPVGREEVAEALWPEETPQHVQRLLSDAAYRLRKTLKDAFEDESETQFFVSAGQRYRLRTHLFRTDVDAFNAHIRRARTLERGAAVAEYGRAIALCGGDFLEHESYEWVEPWRREYHRRLIDACREAARLAAESRDFTKAASFYQTILGREPIDEEAARELMRCYARQGDPNGARKVYKILTQSLRDELDDEQAEPAPETAALLAELTARPGMA